jgi:acetyl-CoA carboxylase biotin carboxyl carrier protein
MLDHIKETLQMMLDHELEEFELRQENLKLRFRKDGRGRRADVLSAAPQSEPIRPTSVLAGAGEEAPGMVVKSSTVGTFYRAEDAAGNRLAEIGQAVKAGQLLAFVRALNLTSEIRSGCNGRIAQVYVEHGAGVGYGDLLFHIRVGE